MSDTAIFRDVGEVLMYTGRIYIFPGMNIFMNEWTRLFTSTLEVWESGLIDTRESLEIVANKISIVTSYYKGKQINAIKVSFVEVPKIPANIF